MTYAHHPACTRKQAEMVATRLILDGLRAETITNRHIADAAARLYPGVQAPTVQELCPPLIYASTQGVLKRGLSGAAERYIVMFAAANFARCIYSRQMKSTEAVAGELDVLLLGFNILDRRSRLNTVAEQERYMNFNEGEKQLLNELEPLLLTELKRRRNRNRAVPASPAAARPAAVKPAAEIKPAAAVKSAADSKSAEDSSKRDSRVRKVLQFVEAQLVLMDLLIYLNDNGTNAVPDEEGKNFFLQVLRESPGYRDCSEEELVGYFDSLSEDEHTLLSCGGNLYDTIDKQFSLIGMLSLLTAMTELPVVDTPRKVLVECALKHMESFQLRYDAERVRRSMRTLAYRCYCASDMAPAAVIERLHNEKAIRAFQIVRDLYLDSLNDYEARLQEAVASKLAEQRAYDEVINRYSEQQRMKEIFTDMCLLAKGGSLGALAMGSRGQYGEEELRVYIRILLQKLEKHGLRAEGLEWTDCVVVATEEMAAACVDEQGNWLMPGQQYSLCQPGWKYKDETLVRTIMKLEN